MKIDLKDFHNLITQENPEIQINLTEDGQIRIAAPEELLGNKDFLAEVENRVYEVVNMALSIGMFLPSELTNMIDSYVNEGGNKDG